jgi:hypothetical protein
MTVIVYASATDHINLHPYDVMVQPHFISLHKEVEKGTFKHPIYEAFDPNLKQKSRITINKMVELYISKSSFDIFDDKDVLSVLHHIDAYVEEVYPLKATNEEVSRYIDRILELRSRIYFLFCRVLNAHPLWKAVYEQRRGIFSIIAEIYGPMGMATDLPETMLKELRMCPTIRTVQKLERQAQMESATPTGPMRYDV